MAQSTNSFLRIESIFNQALAVAGTERRAFVQTLCGENAAMMAEVLSLLSASEAEELATASIQRQPPSIGIQRIGPYAIDRLIGRGGMGAVYLAHRADGQFEQQLAIKVIDLPLAGEHFRERFRQERQILAGLHHPLIARLLDGGVSDEGELYLAMEYVDGTSIHRYCEDHRLAVPQRLALFHRVCEAVQFAHQNLVVHRDLKPDNILIAKDGAPRLLDFGTAKLLSPSHDAAGAESTRQGYHSFTPQYASPEQVLGNPVTTASDTYSLGVLLYLLLSGTLPYDLKEFTTAEMVRVICQEPPRRPTALDPNRKLDADLEAVLLKALRKEPRERYLTADQFASDVQAYLDGLPVKARRGTVRYRAGKFIRRNRVPLAAAVLLAATLLAGIGGVLWQAGVANAERRRAEARSADLRQLSNSLLSEMDEAIKQLPGSTEVQHLLVARVLEHLDRLAKDAQGDRSTQLDLIDAYTRLGNLQGNAYEQNLGNRPAALATLDKAIRLAQPLVAASPRDPQALRALARAQDSRGEVLSLTGNIPEAVENLQAAAHTFDRLTGLPAVGPAVLTEAAVTYSVLGDVFGQDTGLADVAAAIVCYRKSLALNMRAADLNAGSNSARRGVASMRMKLGNAELDADPALALQDFELAVQRIDALPNAERTLLPTVRLRAITVRKVADALSELGEFDRAVPLFEQAIQAHQRLADADRKDLRNLRDLKRALMDEGASYEYAADPLLSAAPGLRRENLRNAELTLLHAESIVKQALKLAPGDNSADVELANLNVRIAFLRRALRQPAAPAVPLESSLAVLHGAAAGNSASPMILDLVVGAFLRVDEPRLADPRFALACAQRGVALTHRKTPQWMLLLAQSYRSAGDAVAARAAAREGLSLLPPPAGPLRSRIRKLLELQART